MPDEPSASPKRFTFKTAEFERLNAADGERTSDPNRVRAHLDENLRRSNDAGLNDVVFTPRRPSRRTRDYIVVMILANLALLLGTVISPVFGAAGLVIFNVGFTWVVWGVMDDY